MPHNLGEELVPDISHHFVAHPIHVVRIPERTEAADRHDRRNGQADEDNRIDFRACVQDFEIRPQRHRVGRSSVENDAPHLGDSGREERIDRAESKTKRQAKYKTPLVRLNVTVEPSIRARRCANGLPKRRLFLCRFSFAHEICAARADSSESIAPITASVEICFIGTRG